MDTGVTAVRQAIQAINALQPQLVQHYRQRRNAHMAAEEGQVEDLKQLVVQGQAICDALEALQDAMRNVRPVADKLEKDAIKDRDLLKSALAAKGSSGGKRSTGFEPWTHPVYRAHERAVQAALRAILYARHETKALTDELSRKGIGRSFPELEQLTASLNLGIDEIDGQLASVARTLKDLLDWT